MEYFKHEYTVQSPESPTWLVKCMRCGVVVQETGYKMMPNLHDKTKQVAVLHAKPLSHQRLVPYLLEDNKGRLSMLHLQLCQDCEKHEVMEDDKPNILRQCMLADVVSLLWCHYPKEAVNAVQEKWLNSKILRRLFGGELEQAYAGKLKAKEEK